MKNRKNILIFGFLPHWYLGGTENFNKILFSYLENKYNIYEIANYELQTFAQKWAFNDRNNKVKTFLFSSPLKKIVFYDNKIKQEKINDITNKKGFLDNIRRIFDYFEKIPVIKYIFKIIRKILNEILVLFNKMQSFKNNKLMEQFIKKNNIGKVITHFDVYKIYNINFKKIHKNFELIAIVHNNINNYFKHTRTERERERERQLILKIRLIILIKSLFQIILKKTF